MCLLELRIFLSNREISFQIVEKKVNKILSFKTKFGIIVLTNPK